MAQLPDSEILEALRLMSRDLRDWLSDFLSETDCDPCEFGTRMAQIQSESFRFGYRCAMDDTGNGYRPGRMPLTPTRPPKE